MDAPQTYLFAKPTAAPLSMIANPLISRFGVVWFGSVWFGFVWFGLVRFGLVWLDLAWQEKLIAENKAGDMEGELDRLRKEVATAEQTAARDQGMLIRAAEERMAALDKVKYLLHSSVFICMSWLSFGS